MFVLNLTVAFTLSLVNAARAFEMTNEDLFGVLRHVFAHFRKNPLSFVLPPKTDAAPEHGRRTRDRQRRPARGRALLVDVLEERERAVRARDRRRVDEPDGDARLQEDDLRPLGLHGRAIAAASQPGVFLRRNAARAGGSETRTQPCEKSRRSRSKSDFAGVSCR